QVDAFEGVVRQFLDGDVVVAEADGFAGGAGRGQQAQFRDRKVAFPQQGEKFLAHRTGGTHDSDANTHVVSVPWLPAGNIGRMEVIRVKSAESLFHTGFERRGKSSKAHGGRPRDSRAGLR